MLNLSSFSSRRSHLDSASYRTLLRIFSLCLDDDQSLNPNPNPNPNPSSDSDSNGDSKSAEEFGRGGTGKGAAFIDDRNPSSQSAEECADEGIEKGIMTDCAKLIDDDTLGQIDVNLEINNQEKDVNVEKGTTTEARQETDLNPLVSECTALRDEMRNNSDESKHDDESKEHGECFNGEAVVFEKSTIVEKTREINVSDGEVDGEVSEEGEISNDLDNLNQPLDSEQEPAGQEDEMLEEGSVCQRFDENQNPNYTMPVSSNVNLVDEGIRTKENYLRNGLSSTLIGAGSNQELEAFVDDRCLKHESCSSAAKADVNLANKKKEKPSETEFVEVRVKKKPFPLSEERKARKKIAKKRKKAQKEREQGVKRLKLQPIMKPKEVKYCNFYLIGRCQKGDSCKFSHDTIPMTKNQPCNFFARNSCLKGDDCPFDHELSKYPCHNYMTEGMCHRGDGCKFSHKLPTTEFPSPASAASKADPRLSSGNSNSAKQLHMYRTTIGAIDQPRSTAASSLQYTTQRPLAGNLVNTPKQPMQIPNGISFLSFGKGLSANADNKLLGNQQKQEKLAAGHRNGPSVAQKSLLSSRSEKTVKLNRPVHNAAANTNAYKKSNDRNLQTEASEASELLEEFLFCGTG